MLNDDALEPDVELQETRPQKTKAQKTRSRFRAKSTNLIINNSNYSDIQIETCRIITIWNLLAE